MLQAAVSRIQTLEDATEEQLKAHADVCAICYSEMINSAKVITQFLIIFCIDKINIYNKKFINKKIYILIDYPMPTHFSWRMSKEMVVCSRPLSNVFRKNIGK